MLVKPLVRPIVRAIAGNPTASLGSGFSPTSLFADGSKGVVYDNNDLTSFYLDSAGTTPATVNGLVGLQLDKSANGSLGAELSAYSTGFSSTAGITGVGASVALSSGSLLVTATSTDGVDRAEIPISGLTVGKYYLVTVVARRGAQGTEQAVRSSTCFDIPFALVLTTSATTYTYRTAATATSGVIRAYVADAPGAIGDELYVNSVSVRELVGNHRYQTTTGSKPVLRGTPTGASLVTNGDFASGTGWSIIDTAPGSTTISGGTATMNNGTTGTSRLRQSFASTAGSYLITFTVSGYSGTALSKLDIGNTSGGDTTYGSIVVNANGTYTRYVDNVTSGTLGLAFIVAAGTATSMTLDNVSVLNVSAGSVTAPYGLQYDGVDDFMQTAAVDFTATDKMFVCAGVRKLSDAAFGTLVELSASVTANNGAFAMFAPLGGSPGYEVRSKGTAAEVSTNVSAGYPAPITNVLTQIANIATPVITLRVNGSQVGSNPATQGTGNYGNYALYFGRRAGTSVPLNGLDFGFVICGKTLTSTQISQTERYIAQRTGVTI